MNDTATHSVPTELCLPALPPARGPCPPLRQRARFASLTEAAEMLDELERQGRAGQLIVTGPGLFTVVWT